MDWVRTQNLPLNFARELQLPFGLACITQRGTVHTLHTADGRYCILMKTAIPFRENFSGTFYCDRPLSESDFCSYQTYDQPCISIAGQYTCLDIKGEEDYNNDFQELYVVKRHNEQLFEVEYTLD
ncbi:hypothetical protein F7734_28945 [Scytonema sp. UIC 10036]|uniref:hypothetical protein n=1 Tax=Scytonema sp. UIC 10036 TaxID=2304196 RepID=UPI0012DA5C9F|nr:hypothetical protein [Scytonema sp. UIC 10036]MUG96151.1 hypothetical protein [Scytonema sp. UIC 10036]